MGSGLYAQDSPWRGFAKVCAYMYFLSPSTWLWVSFSVDCTWSSPHSLVSVQMHKRHSRNGLGSYQNPFWSVPRLFRIRKLIDDCLRSSELAKLSKSLSLLLVMQQCNAFQQFYVHSFTLISNLYMTCMSILVTTSSQKWLVKVLNFDLH